MKRVLILAVILGLVWGIGYAANRTGTNLIEFQGQQATSISGWATVTDNYYNAPCAGKATSINDTVMDTVFGQWYHLGDGVLDGLVIKYELASLDTFGNADSVDTIKLWFQFCPDPYNSTGLNDSSTWVIATSITAVQTSYTTLGFVNSASAGDTLLFNYPGYNYVRSRMYYECRMDSNYTGYPLSGATCTATDLYTKHLPITLKAAYYPIWKPK
jgi:hypothetical protein